MTLQHIKVIGFDADDTLWVNEPYFRDAEEKYCDLLEGYLPRHTINRELFAIEIANLPVYGYGIKTFMLSSRQRRPGRRTHHRARLCLQPARTGNREKRRPAHRLDRLYAALGETRRFPGDQNGEYFAPRFDTRHNLSIVALYNLSRKWQFTATWVYTTGYVSWLPMGRYTFQDVPGGQFQPVVPVYGARNTFRYPAYMRLDLGIVRKWKTRRCSEQDITISIYNASDRRNPYFIFLEPELETVGEDGGPQVDIPTAIKAKQVSLFPILPSVTWNFKF